MFEDVGATPALSIMDVMAHVQGEAPEGGDHAEGHLT